MRHRFALFSALTFGALSFAGACTVVKPNDGAGGSGMIDESGGGGTTSRAGSSGKGGSSGHAGSGGKAGSASAGTSSGQGGANSGGGGAGGDMVGEAGAPQCANSACTSGLCFPDGTCVDCFPSHDTCPSGTVCGSMNTCVPGCKTDGTSCASGVCADPHDCQSCIDDTECGDGNVCGDNKCALACTVAQEGTAQGCSGGLTCCGLHCIAEDTDSKNCGACGNACGDGQFCGLTPAVNTGGSGGSAGASSGGSAGSGGAAGSGGTAGSSGSSDSAGSGGSGGSNGAAVTIGCHDTVIANVCSLPGVAVILDGQDGNETPARAMAAAMAAQCNPAPTVREVSQTVTDALNPASGRPISGAHELLIAAGSSYFARLLGYVDDNHISPVQDAYIADTGTLEFVEVSTGNVLISRLQTEPNDSHDFFVIQLMRDPVTGSIVLNAEGFWESGTVAAAFFFQNGMLPALASFDKAWYVYDWTDQNGDKAPDLDEITLVKAAN